MNIFLHFNQWFKIFFKALLTSKIPQQFQSYWMHQIIKYIVKELLL
jgi:hypothetical protein